MIHQLVTAIENGVYHKYCCVTNDFDILRRESNEIQMRIGTAQ
jgi:hypothetical protein